MLRITAGLGAVVALACAALRAAPPAPQADLDDFMRQVLASRDENWKKLQQYILEESERIDVRGPSATPIWGERREYSWFIRDGFFVRSPISVNGVTISEAERRTAEDDYLRHAKARDRVRAGAPGQTAAPAAAAPQTAAPQTAAPPAAASSAAPPIAPPSSPPQATTPPAPPTDVSGLLAERRAPEFIEAAYFLRFRFDEGTYAFVGHESIDGEDVLRIEYYPAHLFSHDSNKQARSRQNGTETRNEDLDAAVERMMNKVSLVTLWVEPKTHQIVKYTFDNVNFDFLPAAWLVRVTEGRASMTMSQPFKNVWLPKNVDMVFGAMIAIGTFDARYHLDFHDYKEAITTGRIKLGPEERR